MNERRSDLRAMGQLSATSVLFAVFWAGAWASAETSYALTLLLAIPAGGMLVRFFVLQHDCGHHSLFQNRLANDVAGRLISIFTFVPFEQWRRHHATHHATFGNLDRRGVGDITTLTIEEYSTLSFTRRFAYRIYRNPFMMFGLGGVYLILVKQRVPFGSRGRKRWWWVSSQLTNLAIVSVVGVACWAIGFESFLLVHTAVVLVYTATGVFLFFSEHQFENTYWRSDSEWDFREAGFAGSSYLALPRLLQWMTASIGIHHVHHLNPRIPNYRLQDCIDARPHLAETNRLSLYQALRGTRLALWDTRERRLVTFREAARSRAHRPYERILT